MGAHVGADLCVCPDVSAQGAMVQNDDDKPIHG
jgi:hypothetical protein